MPLRLDPLLVFCGSSLQEEVQFLNRDCNGRQVEYLSYLTGKTERDKAMEQAMAELLSQVTGRPVSEEDLDRLAKQSLSETPSIENILGPARPEYPQAGGFEILGQLGSGGMGVVYLARQISLGRLVALKMLPADLADDDAALARFRREIRLLSKCNHPHIVKILTSGTMPDGRLYYAMEYIPGVDLESVWREVSHGDAGLAAQSLGGTTWAKAVRTAAQKQRSKIGRSRMHGEGSTAPAGERQRGPLAFGTSGDKGEGGAGAVACAAPSSAGGPAAGETAGETPAIPDLPLPPLPPLPDQETDPGGYVRHVVGLVRDVARALQTVHEQNLVHRDIKPANLMLTPDGSRIVLMDFGLAKGQTTGLTKTSAGGLLGTLRYAAPEQLARTKIQVGPTVDIRALGVTLWELLARRRAFGDAEDESSLTSAVLHRDLPPLRKIDRTLDRDLEAIVARAVERDAADRLQSAQTLADYLDLYLNAQPVPIRKAGAGELLWRWTREHKALVGMAAAALLVAVVMLGGFVIRLDAEKRKLEAANQRETAARKEAERNLKQALGYIMGTITVLERDDVIAFRNDPLYGLMHNVLAEEIDHFAKGLPQSEFGETVRLLSEVERLEMLNARYKIDMGIPRDLREQFAKTQCILEKFFRAHPAEAWVEVVLGQTYMREAQRLSAINRDDEARVRLVDAFDRFERHAIPNEPGGRDAVFAAAEAVRLLAALQSGGTKADAALVNRIDRTLSMLDRLGAAASRAGGEDDPYERFQYVVALANARCESPSACLRPRPARRGA